MKKAEAIELLRELSNFVATPPETDEALNIAIEKLEQPEIVHCKDCKKWVNGDDIYGICNWNEYLTLQTAKDGFCSCGIRRDE